MRQFINLVEWAETGPKRAWRDVRGWDRVDPKIQTMLQDEFPTMEHLAGRLCPDGSKATFHVLTEGDMPAMQILLHYAEPPIRMAQILNFKKSRVHFTNINITGLKALGTIRRMLRGAIEAYKKLDLQRITMVATNDGSFIWAKMGFLPEQFELLKFRRHFRQKAKTTEQFEDINRLLDMDDPRCLWDIARHPEARFFLDGCNWHGYFNLDDPEQMRQLFRKDKQE